MCRPTYQDVTCPSCHTIQFTKKDVRPCSRPRHCSGLDEHNAKYLPSLPRLSPCDRCHAEAGREAELRRQSQAVYQTTAAWREETARQIEQDRIVAERGERRRHKDEHHRPVTIQEQRRRLVKDGVPGWQVDQAVDDSIDRRAPGWEREVKEHRRRRHEPEFRYAESEPDIVSISPSSSLSVSPLHRVRTIRSRSLTPPRSPVLRVLSSHHPEAPQTYQRHRIQQPHAAADYLDEQLRMHRRARKRSEAEAATRRIYDEEDQRARAAELERERHRREAELLYQHRLTNERIQHDRLENVHSRNAMVAMATVRAKEAAQDRLRRLEDEERRRCKRDEERGFAMAMAMQKAEPAGEWWEVDKQGLRRGRKVKKEKYVKGLSRFVT